jgi:hypothetical protein
MPIPEDVIYSRDVIVFAIREYYDFIAKLYLHETRVKAPPEAGWPSISSADRNILGKLKKTDEVITLLA